MKNPNEFTHELTDSNGDVLLEVSVWYNRHNEIVIYNEEDSKEITSLLTEEQITEVEDAYQDYVTEFEASLNFTERQELHRARHNHRDHHGYLTRNEY